MLLKHRTFQLLLFTCFLATNLPAIAQENFHSGYIITHLNDTIHGYISQVNINIFQKCSFKKTLTDNSTIYTPEEIHAYRFDDNGKFYISKEAPLETGKKLYFLEYLIQGKANIYFMRDDMDHYFAETENDSIMELSERPVLTKNEWGTTYYKQPAFHGKLKYLFKNCPTLFSHIDNTKLQPKDLIKITKEYHDKTCSTERCIIFERKVTPIKMNISVVGGISFNTLSFGTLSRTDFQLSPQLGCKFEFENLFFSSEQSTINIGLLMQKYSRYNRSNYQYGEFTTFINKDNIDVKAIALKVPIAYNYTFSSSKIRPYIGVGFMNTFILRQNKSLSGNFMIPAGKTFTFYQLGAIGVAGIKYRLKNKHIFNTELNYEYSKDLSTNRFTSLMSNSISLSIGYEL